MASTSFTLSNHIITHNFSAAAPPHKRTSNFRVSAGYGYATAERVSENASSFYEILGIQTDASCVEIKSAYRKLARVLHPDVSSSKDTSPDEFMRLHTAYSTLSDPEKREVYDSTIFRRRRRTVGIAGTVFDKNLRRRSNWETDQCW